MESLASLVVHIDIRRQILGSAQFALLVTGQLTQQLLICMKDAPNSQRNVFYASIGSYCGRFCILVGARARTR